MAALFLFRVHMCFFFETRDGIFFNLLLGLNYWSANSGPVLWFLSRILYPLSRHKFTLNKLADAKNSEASVNVPAEPELNWDRVYIVYFIKKCNKDMNPYIFICLPW